MKKRAEYFCKGGYVVAIAWELPFDVEVNMDAYVIEAEGFITIFQCGEDTEYQTFKNTVLHFGVPVIIRSRATTVPPGAVIGYQWLRPHYAPHCLQTDSE